MVSLFYGRISSIDYAAGTANIVLQERENQVVQEVPFLSICYEMPGSGDVVAVLFEEVDGQIGKGVVLGRMFLADNKPGESGAGIFYKQFTGGAGVKYTPETGELEIRVKKVVVDEIEYGTATQKG